MLYSFALQRGHFSSACVGIEYGFGQAGFGSFGLALKLSNGFAKDFN